MAAFAASLAGCGIILGLTDHELFPDDDASAGTSDFDGAVGYGDAAQGPDGAQGASDGSNGNADGGSLTDAPNLSDAGSGGFPDVALPCPWTACAPGATCCYGAGGDTCESSCALGTYSTACVGADQCDAGTCCASLQAVSSGGHGPTGPAPRCNGWAFLGSTCGSCAPATPTACGGTFTLRMCASALDCPTDQPYCCHVVEDNPFTYCVGVALSTSPSTCLPP